MIRIKPNRCGYDGFTCKGAPSLTPIYRTKVLTRDNRIEPTIDDEFNKVAEDGSLESSLIDNYLNIPASITGFVSSVPVLSDLNYLASHISGCQATEGVGSIVDKIHTKSDQLISWVDRENNEDEPMLSRAMSRALSMVDIIEQGLLDFEEGSMGPGVLEVMANPLPDPIDIKGMPDFDMALDGVIFALYNIGKWQDITNERLTREELKTDKTGGSNNLKNILSTIEKSSACSNFKISYIDKTGSIIFDADTKNNNNQQKPAGSTTIDPIAPDKPSEDKAQYSVSSGIIYVNGTAVTVDGIARITAPFYLYVEVVFDEKTCKYKSATLKKTKSKDSIPSKGYVAYIGGVDKEKIKDRDNGTAQYYYKIHHATCSNININCNTQGNLIAGKTGFLYWDGYMIQLIPYKDCKDLMLKD